MRSHRCCCVILSVFFCLVVCSSSSIVAQEQYSATQLKYFETNIRPALVKYCYDCHSVEAGDSRAGLLVDTRDALLTGGDSGPAIVPGQHTESLLWEAINWDGYEMPPSKKMPASVITKFKTWINMGAPDPREREKLEFKTKITKADIEEGRDHWAFQRPVQPPGNIDSIVAERLHQEGIEASPQADAFTLLRRMNFDLVGLPPTPSEIEAFVKHYRRNADDAVQMKVDELLARPQFGERWGRHWLDVARYAESSGSRNVSYPHAWRYRNYVIDAFNQDTPYDEFVTQQIAGDLLPVDTDEEWNRNLIATGFLAIGMKHHDQKNPRKFMADMVDEQIDTTTQAVLGLTVACARCHDHKYDPIPTDDYYRLAGIFYSTKTYYGTTRIGQNHRPSDLIQLPIQDGSSASESRGRGRGQSMESMQKRIAELDQEMRGMQGKDRRQMRNTRNRIASQLASLNPDGTPIAFGMGVQENHEMQNASILVAGEVDQPAQEVQRGFVQVLGDLNFRVSDVDSSGRMQLAKALVSRDNPLTARVMVNRIWMHLMGRPIVESTSNFGFSGSAPENPQLLDYLAVRFMDEGWSIKQLIREVVMSQTYRRSSRYNEGNYKTDPDNKLLWRANPRQIDAEAMRDAMLALSGRLDSTRPTESLVAAGGGRPGRATADGDVHRSVYLPIIRDSLPDSLGLFDFPDPNMTSTGRSDSIVPTQALYLMNGEFAQSQAQSMASNLLKQSTNREQQIRTAFLWAYSRPPTSEEMTASAQFFREFQSTDQESDSRIAISPRRRSSNRPDGTSNERMRRGGPRRAAGGRGMRSPEPSSANNASSHDQALAVFCQTLMASARFRILN